MSAERNVPEGQFMNKPKSTSHDARAIVVRAVVLSLLAVTVATSLGACVYHYREGGYREGGADGWRLGEVRREGGEHGGERR